MSGRVGQQLGNYRLVSFLGKGGFADVYLGVHIHLANQAAIKVLSTPLTGDDIGQFLTEARTLAHLVHPHIVRVLDFGVEGKVPFLVMDYAPNSTLRKRHPKGTRVPLDTVVSYIKQIADALQYAHDEQLIHRDIKPENMLLGRNNEILLGDFGIATISRNTRSLKMLDIVGTAAYMAPEQIQGKARQASDQYSLGIVVYEWICGERPFHGSFIELCTQHLTAPPPPLCEKVPTISSLVDQIVMTALTKDPKQRFACVRDFAIALEEASLGSSTSPPVIASPLQSSRPPSDLGSVAHVTVAAKAANGSHSAADCRDGNVPGWSIKKHRGVVMVLGTLLYGLLIYSVDLAARTSDTLSRPFNASLFSFFAIANIFYCLLRLFPLFFAATYGPWVGLCIAGLGGLIADYIAGYVWNWNWNWNWPLGAALTGFIAGLALLKTRGRYSDAPSVATATVLATIGEVIGLIPPTFGSIWLWHTSPEKATSDFFVQTVPTVVLILLFLPALLVAYDSVVGRKGWVAKNQHGTQRE